VSGGIRQGVHSYREFYHAVLYGHVHMSTSNREMWNNFPLVWSKTEIKTPHGPIEEASIGPALFWFQSWYTRGGYMKPAWDGVVACAGVVGRTLRLVDSSSLSNTVTFLVSFFFFPAA